MYIIVCGVTKTYSFFKIRNILGSVLYSNFHFHVFIRLKSWNNGQNNDFARYGFERPHSRDFDERSFRNNRGYDQHTMMEIEKRNQSLMQQRHRFSHFYWLRGKQAGENRKSPILESRRPPSPRVFYPGSPGQSAQSESPSFISDQSPRGGQSAPVGQFDRSHEVRGLYF